MFLPVISTLLVNKIVLGVLHICRYYFFVSLVTNLIFSTFDWQIKIFVGGFIISSSCFIMKNLKHFFLFNIGCNFFVSKLEETGEGKYKLLSFKSIS